ncbi:hypothetical protein GCM10010981_23720 [Dyella nitratireducens]|uniref:Uncharacterized protein n=1 Tax=Dyella nitratireducens TaxID=1849580 RepID=A0ABQ1FZM8_9GAMM|nr:hypothetical protein GCM10010981_23720 [Dyella nitratireducens]GLQ40806.1 hypothetical protein GCM10007902_06560 [Dyella nitratireducens]
MPLPIRIAGEYDDTDLRHPAQMLRDRKTTIVIQAYAEHRDVERPRQHVPIQLGGACSALHRKAMPAQRREKNLLTKCGIVFQHDNVKVLHE